MRALVVGGRPVERAEPGAEVMVVTNQTPFYGEAGGQIGDLGTIRRGPAVVTVTDTQKKAGGDLYVHIGRLEGGALEVGDTVQLAIDAVRRARLRRAHSATHLLHAALRRHLGDHVTQKGSLVAPDRLRFDFSHPKPVTPEELAAIEAEVNSFLRQNDEVAIRLMDREAAIGSRRHGAVRREIRRRGAGRAHGPRARRQDHVGRALRRHPRPAAPATSRCSRLSPNLRSRPGSAGSRR